MYLDGSGSTDDVAIAEFHWEQLEGGPNKAHLSNLIRSNASGLTKGKYNFR